MEPTFEFDPEVEEAWALEIERRIAEIDAGTVTLIDFDVAMAKLRAELSK